jgi:hypothetical protein
MQLPEASTNIYPRTVDNIKAILEFYFPYETHSEIEETALKLYEKRGVALNQLEFTSKFVAEHTKDIAKIIASRNLWNLMRDTRDALFVAPEKWEARNGTNTPKLEALKNWIDYN